MSNYLKKLTFLTALGMGWAGAALATPLEEPNFCVNPIGYTPWICQAVACESGENLGKTYFLNYQFTDGFIDRIVFTTENELPYITVEKLGVKLFVPICQEREYYEGIMAAIKTIKENLKDSEGIIQLPARGTKANVATTSLVAASLSP